MICKGSDLQNAGVTALFSSGYASAGGILVTEDNLRNSAMVFTVRRLVRQTWLNDRDQFLIPNKPIPPEFAGDCLIWMICAAHGPLFARGSACVFDCPRSHESRKPAGRYYT
ncbi:hypothetical protein VQ042_06470 [Aurantimonas sp. A2-1-M11]|uniref:hypothetical protein n=1 Tax=Aurantimonas sp. A2-1-M11 TaxID=3113712 RepID=UPI002F92DAB2